jgi:hypothetical protein
MAAMMGMQPMMFGSPPHGTSAPLQAQAAPPVQLQPINPLQAVYPIPVLPPAPHMMAGGWAGANCGVVCVGLALARFCSLSLPCAALSTLKCTRGLAF